jgi:alcohol sulfotransferase
MLSFAIKQVLKRARRERLNAQLSAEAGRIDVFLASYPKSGRTWLRFILSHYFAAKAELGFEPDLRTKFRVLPNFDLTADRGLPGFVGKGPQLPLIAVTHRAFDSRLFKDRPAIVMVRDIRDVLVSAYFHQTRQKGRFNGSMSAFIENTDLGVTSIIAFLNSWARHFEDRRSHVVSYERLSADAHGEVAAILRFIGVPVDAGHLDAAITAGQFDRMRKLEVADGIPGHLYDRSDGEALRMRKGVVGGYTDYLSDGEVERIDQLCRAGFSPKAREMLERAGLTV